MYENVKYLVNLHKKVVRKGLVTPMAQISKVKQSLKHVLIKIARYYIFLQKVCRVCKVTFLMYNKLFYLKAKD